MPAFQDGPASPLFTPIPFRGNVSFDQVRLAGASPEMQSAATQAPSGECVCWGIPFHVKRPFAAKSKPVSLKLRPFKTKWLAFLHTADTAPIPWNRHGFVTASRGIGRLGEPVANYVLIYADGTQARHTIRRRYEVGMFHRGMWGENCVSCVCHQKPHPVPLVQEQAYEPPYENRLGFYGISLTRVVYPDFPPFATYIWAWQNPHPGKRIVGLQVEPAGALVLIFALTAGDVSESPIRWNSRRKAIFRLSPGTRFDPALDERGQLKQIALDLGQVISAEPRQLYPNRQWGATYNNQLPRLSARELLIEYAAHPDACFHIGAKRIPVSKLHPSGHTAALAPVAPATQRVEFRVVERGSRRPVPVRLHVHGEAGEYLPPIDRHRRPATGWIEDYSVDFVHQNLHRCAYISGETVLQLPIGRVYIEVSKGFEIRPVRKTFRVTPATKQLVITLDKVLRWRERGWVTADTHVHFLSPATALLEGAAEGVNVVNLLASQWGELMTNVGDFDGKTTFGSKEAGGDGEWLVRVGTENRQHVLGHISLLGYGGRIIAPLCAGGPDESAIGDPVNVLLAEWARQCKAQGGLVVMPHFPNPRLENAANLISGEVDAVEMCSWDKLYDGIDPYSLSDWYRYLNCGYFHPAVGGTDKMTALTPVGAIRTYARLPRDREFTYSGWMDAIRSGNTFVTYGPLLEFTVSGNSPVSRIRMKSGGGTVDVEWNVASVTMPMSRVELVVNGEIRESVRVNPKKASGHWSCKIERSSWLALLVRGHYRDKPEIIAAHSSPVAVEVAGTPFFAAADAATILEQIEGAMAYIDTIGTRAETSVYKRMRRVLTAAHRRLHNELHRQGRDHSHTIAHQHHD